MRKLGYLLLRRGEDRILKALERLQVFADGQVAAS